MPNFADFAPLCTNVPSYPWCNLFYRQLLDASSSSLTGVSSDPTSAPVGINPVCGILKAGKDNSIGNIANIIACALSIVITTVLVLLSHRRKAAVGRSELRLFFAVYLVTLPLQLISTGSLLTQGSTPLVAITAVHAGLVAALFWVLLGNAIVATQIVEDGTMSSLLPISIFAALIFGGTTFIALDVALHISGGLGPFEPILNLNSIPLFVLTSIWPAVAALGYIAIMAYVVLGVLREQRPMWFFLLSAVLFVLSQLAWFLLGKILCKSSNAKVDGSFLATLLETASAVVLYFAWKSITEESFDDYSYPR